MEITYTDQMKHLLKKVYSVTDKFEAGSLGENSQPSDPNAGMRGMIRADVLLFIFRIIDKGKPITDKCVEYLNECLGYSFTLLTAEMARKKADDIEKPPMCFLLPMFVLLDKQLGETIYRHYI